MSVGVERLQKQPGPKKKKAKKKAERGAAGKKQAISIQQFEKKVRELMKDGKSNQRAIKMILEKYEIR